MTPEQEKLILTRYQEFLKIQKAEAVRESRVFYNHLVELVLRPATPRRVEDRFMKYLINIGVCNEISFIFDRSTNNYFTVVGQKGKTSTEYLQATGLPITVPSITHLVGIKSPEIIHPHTYSDK